jgi:uncharacterized protein with NAD-binding domain and iron-sulfur cluster
VDLVDAGHQVDLYEARPFLGGKVGSWVDEGGNHIEMGLHVFFFNYANLFALMRKVGAIDNLLPKDHTYGSWISASPSALPSTASRPSSPLPSSTGSTSCAMP